jgi:DNA excision repair protein ERCC-2
MVASYFCRKCGKIYPPNEYLEIRYCKDCGALLFKDPDCKPPIKTEADLKNLVKEFFPYSNFRLFQFDAIKFTYEVMMEGRIGLLCSPCGTGKSISVLTAFFAARKVNPNLGRLLVLTRTKNQLEIYSRELKNIKDICGVSFVASIFKSKKEMCPQVHEDPKISGINYRDFLYYCRGLKSGLFGNTCEYYNRVYDRWRSSRLALKIVDKIKGMGSAMPEEVYELCSDYGLCPYEITRILARHADIIVGNYNYMLVDAIRGSILGRAGIKTREINCIFDEAHSLPYYAAGILSDELSSKSVKIARKEIETFHIDDYGLLEALREVMVDLGKRTYKIYGAEVEHLIEKDTLVNALTRKLTVNAEKFKEIVSELADKGEDVRQKRVELGKSPVSYLSHCAEFILDWLNNNGASYVRYVKVEVGRNGKKRVKLGIRCLDPSFSASVINELRSAVLMSGTLWNPDYYVDVLGINRTRCRSLELPSPFPAENRLIIVDKSVTTKFEKRSKLQWKRVATHLTKIVQVSMGRVAVYVPSYEVMQEVATEATWTLPTLFEEKSTKISDVLDFLKKYDQCIVFGVARGKISEGVDMTEGGKSMLSAVIIVGLPFPKKTELQTALYKYFREKFGKKAIEYANTIPCLNALAQSAGRLIRSPEDRGVVIMMDGRAAGRFKRNLPADWQKEMKAYFKIEKILDAIEKFMQRG